MKIRINYGLIEKATLAKKGFSIKKCARKVIMASTAATMVLSPIYIAREYTAKDFIEASLKSVMIYIGLYGFDACLSAKIEKSYATHDLAILANKLDDICIDTNADLLMNSYPYKTEYKVNFEAFPPRIEQKKYIMVPVNNEWGNNERSLLQEHVIGTREYDISYGEPEQEKVYSYGTRKMINN